jgi:hypothetical protein
MMRTSLTVLLLAVLPLAADPQVRGAEDSPAKADAEQLISNLGSDEYAVREQATEALTQLGLPAIAALETAAGHPDREVRYRARRVLGIVRQHDLQRRLEAFLSGDDGNEGIELPGWQRFEKKYGDGPAARSLFVDIQRADPELMQALESTPRAAGELLIQRTSEFQQQLRLDGQQLSLGQVAASLFVAGDEEVKLPAHVQAIVFSQCFQAPFRDVAISPARSEIPRQLMGTLVRRCDEAAAYQGLNVAYHFQVPEGVVLAQKTLASKDLNRQPSVQQYALMTIARLGDKSHLPLVDKLLDDNSLLSRSEEAKGDEKIVYELQMRDAALAAAVILSKQNLQDYFDMPDESQNLDLSMILFNARVIGFTSDEKRAEAFAKWQKWKAAAK